MTTLLGARSSVAEPGFRASPRPPARLGLMLCLLLVAAAAGASSAVSPAVPVGVAAVALLVVAIWRRPVVAAVVVVALVPALAGLGRGVGVPGLKVSEVLLALCAAVLLLRRPAAASRWSGVEYLLLLFAVTAAGIGLFHAAVTGSTLDSLLRVGLQPALLLLTWWTARRGVVSAQDLMTVLRWTLVVSLVPALMSVLQFLDVPGVRALVSTLTAGDIVPEPGSDSNRVTGPFPIWHSLGGYLVLPTVLAMVLVVVGDRTVLRARTLAAVVVLDLTAVVLSVTVTVLAWVPVAFLVAAALCRRTGRALLMLGAAALVAAAVFEPVLVDRLEQQSTAASGTSDGLLPQTVAYRVLVWQRDYLPLLSRGVAYGVGNDLPDTVFFPSTENQYLTYLLRGGVLLLLAAVAVIGAVLARSLRLARTGVGPRVVAAATIAGVLVFLPAAAMLWPYLTNAGLPAMLFGLGGAVLGRPPRTPFPGTTETRAGRAGEQRAVPGADKDAATRHEERPRR